MAKNELDPPIVVDTKQNPGVVRFTSIAQAEKWAQAESATWSKFPEVKRPGVLLFNFGNRQGAAAAEVLEILKAPSDPKYLENWRTAVVAKLEEYADGKIIHSKSVWGRAAIELAARSPEEAAAFLWAAQVWVRQRQGRAEGLKWWDHGGFNGYEGLAFASLARAAITADEWGPDEVASRKAALTELNERMLESQHKWDGVLEKAQTDSQSARDAFVEQRKEHTETFDALIEKITEVHTDELAAHKKRLAELEVVFQQKIKLEAPVTYWRDKAKSHGRAAVAWGLASAMAMLMPLVLLFVVIWERRDLPRIFMQFQEHLSTGGVALLLVFVILYLAFVRIVVKQFATNIALHADAEERIVMAQTFLALVRDEKITEAERALILGPLFRPATIGGDDMAASLSDLMAKSITSHKSST